MKKIDGVDVIFAEIVYASETDFKNVKSGSVCLKCEGRSFIWDIVYTEKHENVFLLCTIIP